MREVGVAIVVLAIVLTSGNARAGFLTGNRLLDICNAQPPDFVSPGVCLGYIEGIIDSAAVTDKSGREQFRAGSMAESFQGYRWCQPANSEMGQAVDVVQKWLKEHPEKRHFSTPSLVAQALADAFPCK